MFDPRNSAEFDLECAGGVTARYLVASLPRSGSTLLCRALWDTALAGAPKEYFNAQHMADFAARFGAPPLGPYVRSIFARPRSWGRYRMESYLHRLEAIRTSPNGVFGAKIHIDQIRSQFQGRGLDPQRLLGHPRFVQITRSDRLRQAISFVRAMQTGQWSSEMRSTAEPRYDPARIRASLERIEREEAEWQAFFRSRSIQPFETTHEELVADHEAVIRAVLDFLEVPGREAAVIHPPTLRKQADATTEEWIERFRSTESH